MSELDKLLLGIEVEWKALDDISDIYGGLKGKAKMILQTVMLSMYLIKTYSIILK